MNLFTNPFKAIAGYFKHNPYNPDFHPDVNISWEDTQSSSVANARFANNVPLAEGIKKIEERHEQLKEQLPSLKNEK